MLTPVNIPPVGHSDYTLISSLLHEALQLLEADKNEARRRIECACTLAYRDEAIPAHHGALARWQRRRVEAYIRDNFELPLRIEDVAAVINLSPSYFSRAFKATVGITYSEFVLRERIDLAKRLLLTTDTPIAQIALACGFSDQSHMTRNFRNAVGDPPGAWRRKNGGLSQNFRPIGAQYFHRGNDTASDVRASSH